MISTNTPTDALARAQALAARADLWDSAKSAVAEAEAAQALADAAERWRDVADMIDAALLAHPSRWKVLQLAISEAIREARQVERRADALAAGWHRAGCLERQARASEWESRRNAARAQAGW